MITICSIRTASDELITTGKLLSQEQSECQIQVDDLTLESKLSNFEDSFILHLVNNTYGIRIFSATLVKVKFNTLFFTNMQPLKTIQRRNDVKIKALADLKIQPIMPPMPSENSQDIIDEVEESPPFISITMSDISAGGIGFYCKQELNKRLAYSLEFPLTRPPIHMEFFILRCATQPDGGFFYGCQFKKMPPPSEQALRAFIYRRGLFQSPDNR